jgi:hypothetical protein
MSLASAWNGSIHKLRVLAEGENWSLLLKVGVQLCVSWGWGLCSLKIPNMRLFSIRCCLLNLAP